ncbi:MAG TPA: mycofactocin biosynthesis glycosyltransferase MftF [Acidimicrobiales bacterium]|nr:mycofactocin biosynthesis glycosyltransferase MftF [Acidimicrobiales bacterium]
MRVLRLTPAGARLLDRWSSGEPIGSGPGAGVLAARLVEAGAAHPVPPAEPGRSNGRPAIGDVAVVIPVRDDQPGLDTTLDALAATAPGVPVVVVDDGSATPMTVGDRIGVSLIRQADNRGPGGARNTGWQAAAPTDVIAFVDAGCLPSPGWLEILLPHLADPATAAVAPRITTAVEAGTPPGLAAYEQAHSPLDLGPRPAPVRPGSSVPYVPTTCLVVRRADLVAAGGFDPGFRFGEDVDLVWRLGEAGRRIRYEPAATASHPARPSVGAWARQRFDYGRSAAVLAARHGRAAAPMVASPWSTAVWGLAVAGHPMAAAGLAGGSAVALGRRAGRDRTVAAELRHLALTGTLRSAGALASAVRRAWLPPALGLATLAWAGGGRRTRARVVAVGASIALGPGLVRCAAGEPLGWAAWSLADDLAYQAGVWAGVTAARSGAALLPRW